MSWREDQVEHLGHVSIGSAESVQRRRGTAPPTLLGVPAMLRSSATVAARPSGTSSRSPRVTNCGLGTAPAFQCSASNRPVTGLRRAPIAPAHPPPSRPAESARLIRTPRRWCGRCRGRSCPRAGRCEAVRSRTASVCSLTAMARLLMARAIADSPPRSSLTVPLQKLSAHAGGWWRCSDQPPSSSFLFAPLDRRYRLPVSTID